MERAMIERHLVQAEEHVLLGEKHILRQREILAELDRGGHDTTQAAALLVTLEESQILHVADRDRLKEERALLD